mmetsp:Transcript_31818/g.68404  ORF Transcript_31818/g.68404 Transcript_31818/m.68404 type:complete len:225 (+) Transcript_31818:273-947(+)
MRLVVCTLVASRQSCCVRLGSAWNMCHHTAANALTVSVQPMARKILCTSLSSGSSHLPSPSSTRVILQASPRSMGCVSTNAWYRSPSEYLYHGRQGVSGVMEERGRVSKTGTAQLSGGWSMPCGQRAKAGADVASDPLLPVTMPSCVACRIHFSACSTRCATVLFVSSTMMPLLKHGVVCSGCARRELGQRWGTSQAASRAASVCQVYSKRAWMEVMLSVSTGR